MLPHAARLEWEAAVGSEQVVFDPDLLRQAGTATFATQQQVMGILRPETRDQVRQCLCVASRHRVSVYPISTGKNWGYGSRVPVTNGCVLLDLGRMNRILDFNEDLAYVTVEPGVTQAQLFAFLRERKSKLWIDATGSSPDCSVLGNTLERGFGHTPYGDHAENVCGMEVVFPNGETLETGFHGYQNAQAAPVYRWGLGPSLDGLFLQSNFGVVTRMTIWLMPAPEYFTAFFFRSDDEVGLAQIVEALRPLRLNGTLRSAIHIGNDYKVLAGIGQYPWREAGEVTPLTPELMKQLRRQKKFGAWSGSGGLYGTRPQVAEGKRLVRAALKGKVERLQFLDQKLLNLASRFARPFGMVTGWDLSQTMELAKPVFGLMQGVPTDRSLASAYWRKRTPPPAQMDPDRDGCGLLWCAPVAPSSGTHAQTLAALSTEILLRHGFEPLLSLTLITPRSLICVISLTYDRAVDGEDQRAEACFKELQGALTQRGYLPYRLGIQSMDELRVGSAHRELWAALKRHADPEGILAPGRYEPAAPEAS